MKRLYIDVTQLVKWQGKLTGIPRVMSELSLRYRAQGNVTFIVWDSINKFFHEVSPDILDRQPSANSIDNQDTPSFYRRYATKIAPKSVKKVLRSLKYQAAISVNTSTYSVKKVQFSKNDLLFILWGDWVDDEYIGQIVLRAAEGVKIVQIAYDMLPIVTPQYSGHATESLTKYATAVYPICSLVLSISQHTKIDIEDWLKSQALPSPDISVFRLGDDFAIAKSQKPKHELFTTSSSFLLMVGTVEARKNHALMYYVYKLAKQRGIILPKLVIVGRRGWMTENIYELITTDPETKNELLFMHDVNDEELSWLYSNALFSVYPSLYEGWGLPIAESLSRGVPCVASNTSSMTEISRKGVVYFSPASTDECLGAITSLLDRNTLKKFKKEASNYKQVDWDHTFNVVSNYIEGLK